MLKRRAATMSADFIPCREMSLPEDQLIVAALRAIDENPNNEPNTNAVASEGLVLPPAHLAVLTTKYWGVKGIRLTVGFMESAPEDLKNMILSHMNAWSEWGNIEFVLSNTDPQVRITRSGQGYWSYLGTDILSIPRNQPTMCLQGFTMNTPVSERRRVITHEAGHTCGFPHEHMRKDIIARLDYNKTIDYFKRTQGWSATTTQQQVLTPLNESSIMGTPTADEMSIMTYMLPGSITKDGKPIAGGADLAPQDKEFVRKIYPKAVIPPTDPEPGAQDLSLSMDFAKKIVSISLLPGWKVQAAKPAATTKGK